MAAVADGAIKHLLGNSLSFPQEDNEGENEFGIVRWAIKNLHKRSTTSVSRSRRLRMMDHLADLRDKLNL